jgi:hypothetical protein
LPREARQKYRNSTPTTEIPRGPKTLRLIRTFVLL